MLPEAALIKSGKSGCFNKKLFGQYPLERNIRMLWQGGFGKIYLSLDDAEMKLFESSIKRNLGKINNSLIINEKPSAGDFLEVESAQFYQFSAFSDPDRSFKKARNKFTIVQNDEQYILKNEEDFTRASKLAVAHIRTSSGGWIARNINKRISIPISLLLSRTRVHPNFLTFVNFLVGTTGGILLLSNNYYHIAAAGCLVQSASIFDGCDGEVAKMTTKFSKLGGLLDSLSDHSLALLLVGGAIYQMYNRTPLQITVISSVFLVVGILMCMGAIFYYLFKYSESRSFVGYAKEFYDRIPKKYFMIKFMDFWKYILRKECYSFVGLFFCLSGMFHYFAFFMGVALFFGGALLLLTNIRFFPDMDSFREETAMVYISRKVK